MITLAIASGYVIDSMIISFDYSLRKFEYSLHSYQEFEGTKLL